MAKTKTKKKKKSIEIKLGKKGIVISPKGAARYPKLFKPGQDFKTKKGMAKGKYDMGLILEGDEADALMEFINNHQDELIAEHKKEKREVLSKGKLPYVPELDEDGEETGRTIFKFTKKAYTKDEKLLPGPYVIDASRTPIGKDVSIYGGSTVKVAFKLTPYGIELGVASLSASMVGVQVLELVSGAESLDDCGFEEEDGFNYTEEEESESTSEDSDEDEEDEDDEEEDF